MYDVCMTDKICKHCGKTEEEHDTTYKYCRIESNVCLKFEPLENHNPKRISSLCVRDSQYKTEEGNGKAVNKAPNQNVKANDCSEQTSNTQREQTGAPETTSHKRFVPSDTLADKELTITGQGYFVTIYKEEDIKTALKEFNQDIRKLIKTEKGFFHCEQCKEEFWKLEEKHFGSLADD